MKGADDQAASSSINERRKGILRLLETDLEKKDRTTKVFQFIFPWILFLIVATVTVTSLTAVMGWDQGRALLDIWIFYTLPPAGKESLIPSAVSKGVPGFMAGISASAVDICVSMFLIWNYDWVKKLPIIGPALERTEAKGRQKAEKTRWFSKATFILTTFFVFVPFSGSGGVGGTVFGRIVGLRPYRVLLAVALGSFIGSTGFAILSETLTNFLGSDNPVIYFLSNLNILQLVAVLIIIGFVLYTIRNPKMAAVRTNRVVAQALDMSEKALDAAEKRRKEATTWAVRGTKDSILIMGDGSRMLSDLGLEIATKPMELMGRDGRRIKNEAKDFSMRQIDRAHKLAGGAIDRTIDFSEKTTSRSIEFAASLSKEGLKETRAGWNEAGKALERAGEGIERIYPKKKNKNKPEIDKEDAEEKKNPDSI